MDANRFDGLVRTLASPASRRTLGSLMAFLGGLLSFLVFDEEAGAKRSRGKRGGARVEKKKKKKKKKPYCLNGQSVEAAGKKKKKQLLKQGAIPGECPTPPPCPQGSSQCDESCVDTTSDVTNCGSCGAICAAGQSCQGGACTCNGQRCAGCCNGATCQHTNSDARCGLGGVACTACAGGRTCQNGHCACPSGQEICSDSCVDLLTNQGNCGACSNDCATHETCQGGVCGVACGTEGFCPANSNEADCCGGTCKNVSNDLANCGACGNVCPGTGPPTANVACQAASCTFSCQGSNYDVNNNPSDGCEVADPQTNRAQSTAQYLGTLSNCDTNRTFTGTIFSDSRAHSPEPFGFNVATGAAPLWYLVSPEVSIFCQNDPFVALTMTGGSSNCYKLTVITNQLTREAIVTNGAAVINMGPGSYPDGPPIFFKVEKICSHATSEVANFSATFHL